MSPRPTVLCILDGFGLNPNPLGNAVHQAKKPNFERIVSNSPHSTLVTFGERVGLPEGQMGNSEVGHLNIGAGRVVEQWLLRISRALSNNSLGQIASYKNFIDNCRAVPRIHLIGLYSDGGVHSDSKHLKLLITRLCQDTSRPISLHLITDGRDTGPQTGKEQITDLVQYLETYPQVSIATISGRFFAMDRDKRWERVEKAYRAIVCGEAPHHPDPIKYLQSSYDKGITDEFVESAIFDLAALNPSDGIIFWNFRSDRMREIVSAICSTDFNGFKTGRPCHSADRVLCFAEYDPTFKLPFLFELDSVNQHLGQVISEQGLKQLRVAETEKYPHVTYFFNGGVEASYPSEERKMVASPRDVKTYDLKPEMSAAGVCQTVVDAIISKAYDFIVVNFANCDMVGHTGVMPAAVSAVETVDGCLGQILSALDQVGGQAVIIADHGNAEQMINYQDGTPHTAHTTYPVPIIVYGADKKISVRDGGALCDVAPTILQLMGIPQPAVMAGSSLLI